MQSQATQWSGQRFFRRMVALTGLVLALGSAPAGLVAQDSTRTIKASQLDFSGVLWTSLSLATDSAAKSRNGGRAYSQFNVDRLYLTFRMPVGEDVSVRVTTDIFQGDQSATSFYRGWALRAKYAWLQYDFLHDIGGLKGFNAVARVGLIHTVAVDHEEQYWLRYLTLTAIERDGFFSSSDAGAAVLVTLPDKRGELYATITNGPGYTSGETDRFKDLALRATFTPFANSVGYLQKLVISPWAYFGSTASAHQRDATPATLGPVSDGLRRDRYGLFLANPDRRFSFGLDWATRIETYESGANTIASARLTADTAGVLTDVWFTARPTEITTGAKSRFGILGRYDHFVPKSGDVSGLDGAAPSTRFIVLGAFWEPNARATVAVDWQQTTSSHYLPATRPAEGNAIALHVVATF